MSRYSHFSSKNNNVFENTLATTVNGFVINELVKLNNWALELVLGLIITVNSGYKDSICSQKYCHQNEFAVVKNH